MSSFEVTPAELEGLAGRLMGLLGELEQAAGSISAGSGGAAQNGQLEGAIDGFVIDWVHGLQQLQTRLSELSRRLEYGSAVYASTEAKLTGGFRAE